jgi:hypothetical protein
MFSSIMSRFLSEELLLNASDWIGCDVAIRPEPRKRFNWTMVGETLVQTGLAGFQYYLDQHKKSL